MKRGAFLLFAAAAFTLCYSEVVGTLAASMIRNSTYSYGFIVFLVSAYILWSKRAQLRGAERSPDYILGVPVTLAGIGMLIAGRLGLLASVQEASLVVTVGGFVLLLLGRRAFGVVSFPLLYLLLGIPMWDGVIARLQPPSQLLSAGLASALLQVIGIPVLRQGTRIVLPNVALEVMRECSGVNQVLALVSLALPAAYLTLRSSVRRALLVALAVLTAYISNGIRIALVGFLTYHDLGDGDLRGSHLFEGLAVSVLSYLVLFGCLNVLSADERKKARRAQGTSTSGASGSASPRKLPVRHPVLEYVVVSTMLIVGISNVSLRARAVPLTDDLRAFPKQVGDWTFDTQPEAYPNRFPAIDDELVQAYPSAAGERRFTAIDDELLRVYRNSASERLHLYIGYDRRQEEGRELVAEAGHALDAVASPVYLQLPSGAVQVGQIIRNSRAVSRGLLYWYDFNGRAFSNLYRAKSYLVWDALTRRRTNGAVIMIGWEARDGSDPEHLRLKAASFARAILTLLPRFIPS